SRLGRRAGEAVVGRGRDSGRERLGRTEPRDREHRVVVELPLSADVGREPVAERAPVAEPGVHGVLEVGMGVDEPGEDDRVVVGAVGWAVPYLADPAVLPGDVAVGDRRAVDRDDPAGGDGAGHVSKAGFRRVALRSRIAQRMIESSKSTKSGTAWSVVVTG